MWDLAGISIERFDSITAIFDRFGQLTGVPHLRMLGGPQSFFLDFRKYLELPAARPATRVIGLPPDPNEFLVFPTPGDELSLAIGGPGHTRETWPEVIRLAAEFELPERVLHQSMSSLSGGERVLVGLAKIAALEPSHDEAVVACPSTWLFPANRHLVLTALRKYADHRKLARILLLNGEWPELDGTENNVNSDTGIDKLAWTLDVDGLTVSFPSSEFPKQVPERKLEYRHQKGALSLLSPTVVQGNNGVGKSTLAHILAGALKAIDGDAELTAAGLKGTARLVMQDSLTQAFGKSPIEHLNLVFKYDDDRRKAINTAADELSKQLRIANSTDQGRHAEVNTQGHRTSVLETKVMLSMERVGTKPILLILDEPTWGLSVGTARDLVTRLTEHAHKNQIAVAIIAHQTEWLSGLVKSRLSLTNDGGQVWVDADAV